MRCHTMPRRRVMCALVQTHKRTRTKMCPRAVVFRRNKGVKKTRCVGTHADKLACLFLLVAPAHPLLFTLAVCARARCPRACFNFWACGRACVSSNANKHTPVEQRQKTSKRFGRHRRGVWTRDVHISCSHAKHIYLDVARVVYTQIVCTRPPHNDAPHRTMALHCTHTHPLTCSYCFHCLHKYDTMNAARSQKRPRVCGARVAARKYI